MIERLLHVALLAPGSPQLGLRSALHSICREYREFDWKKFGDNIEVMHRTFLDTLDEFKPDLTFAQIMTAGVFTPEILKRIPGVKVEWCGDCRDELDAHYLERAPYMDCSCFTNMRDVETVRAAGYRSEFLNIGFSPTIFTPDGAKHERVPQIIFCGNHYGKRFPCSDKRMEMVLLLQRQYRQHFAVYGKGWTPIRPWLSEPAEAAAYRACRIAIDMNHYDDVPRFFSDRRLRIMASGAFCIANHNPGIEEDFEVGKHLVTFKDIAEIPNIVNHYLANEKERAKIAAAGCAHVREHHSWTARMPSLLEIAEVYAGAGCTD